MIVDSASSCHGLISGRFTRTQPVLHFVCDSWRHVAFPKIVISAKPPSMITFLILVLHNQKVVVHKLCFTCCSLKLLWEFQKKFRLWTFKAWIFSGHFFSSVMAAFASFILSLFNCYCWTSNTIEFTLLSIFFLKISPLLGKYVTVFPRHVWRACIILYSRSSYSVCFFT